MQAIESMRRTLLAAAAACVAAIVLTIAALALLPAGVAGIVAAVGAAGVVAAAVLTAAMALLIRRQRDIADGRGDMFLAANAPRSEAGLGGGARAGRVRRLAARMFYGHDLVVGDVVRVRSLEQIRGTLDADGTLDGLPFMAEMAALCGKVGRVYRVVDKIYDYGRSRRMRRLDDAVILVGLRCNGSGHGGCEAACYLIWKRQWLERVEGSSHPAPTTDVALPLAAPRPTSAALQAPAQTAQAVYRCQYTQLSGATRPLAALDVSRLLGAAIVGNVTLRAFIVAVLTRYADLAQRFRGGAHFLAIPERDSTSPEPPAAVSRGQRVTVRTPAEIARTLDANGKNKGLWFDADMVKHCGRTYTVLGHVERIIDVTSGRMISMKSPCVILDGVHYSGELQWFGEQHDYSYWREIWLRPSDGDSRS